jgi:hypothetical protein
MPSTLSLVFLVLKGVSRARSIAQLLMGEQLPTDFTPQPTGQFGSPITQNAEAPDEEGKDEQVGASRLAIVTSSSPPFLSFLTPTLYQSLGHHPSALC